MPRCGRAGREHPIKLDAEPIQVPTDKAVSLGRDRDRACHQRLQIRLPARAARRHPHQDRWDGESVCLVVEDDGVGSQETETPRGTGLGTRIVTAMASSLRTTVTANPDHAGTSVSLRFAL